MDNKISGIYVITNEINGKQYVGLSTDCMKRWADHYSKSYHSNREDDKNKTLYCAMRKYGRDNFSFKILEECSSDYQILAEREIYWISKLDSYNNGYNQTPGGDIPCPEKNKKGEEHGMAKLSEVEVIECRKLYEQGARCREIWELNYKDRMSFGGFQRMWHGKTWKHVMPEVFDNNPHPRIKCTPELVQQIKTLYSDGKTCAEIYEIIDRKISRTSVNDICNNRRWKDLSAM